MFSMAEVNTLANVTDSVEQRIAKAFTREYENETCPRCQGAGFIWIDSNPWDLPGVKHFKKAEPCVACCGTGDKNA